MFAMPGVVRMIELLRERGTAYLVMEHLQGRTLHSCIEAARQGDVTRASPTQLPLHEEALWHIALELLRTLSALHQRGVLHLDIKPANVMWCDDGRVVLMDFGSARQMPTHFGAFNTGSKDQNEHEIGHERNESWAYTPGFSPPELEPSRQRTVESVQAIGSWSDLYAWAACLKQGMVALQSAGSQESAHNAHLRDDRHTARWTAALEACLQTDHRQRPASALQLLQQLQGSS